MSDSSENAPTRGPIPPSAPTQPMSDIQPVSPNDSVTPVLGSPPASLGLPPSSVISPPTRATTSPTIRLFGDYDLLHEVSRGGMGIVYRAHQRSLGRQVALKMILEGRLASTEAVHRFHQEARAAARLDHPGIVPVYEVNECEGHHYFTMAFIEGSTLSSLVDKRGALPFSEAATLVQAVAQAIDYAHRRGVVHRDLKPSNILIDSEGRPRVTDFGLAKSLGDVGGLTSPGQVLGTPSFMAPEQAKGDNAKVGPAADIYALGGLLYYVLTARPPFFSDSIMDLLQQVVYQPPAAPHTLRPNMPKGLEDICLKCLQKDPSQRYASAAEVAAALEPWRTQQVGTKPPPVPRRSGSRLGGIAACAAVALIMVGTLWFVRHQQAGAGGAAGAGGSAPVAMAPAQPRVNAAAKEENAVPKLAAPAEATHHDFDLQVDLVGAKRDEVGDLRLVAGKKVQFRIAVDRKAYVGIWNVPPEGKGPIVQIFPNQYEHDNLVTPGKPRQIPASNYTITAELSSGAEEVWAVAANYPWDPIEGEIQGPYTVFKTPAQRQQWEKRLRQIRTRGFRLQATDKEAPAVAEQVLHYRVVTP